jgi:hypothetical protein
LVLDYFYSFTYFYDFDYEEEESEFYLAFAYFSFITLFTKRVLLLGMTFNPVFSGYLMVSLF